MKFVSTAVLNYKVTDPATTLATMPDGFMENNFSCSFCDDDNSFFYEPEIAKILDYMREHPTVIFAEDKIYRDEPHGSTSVSYNNSYETFVIDFERIFERNTKRGHVSIMYNVHFFNRHKITFSLIHRGDTYNNAFRNLIIDDLLHEI